MKKTNPFNRSRIIASITMGFVFAIVVAVSTWVQPRGNNAELIDSVEKIIEKARLANTTNGQGRTNSDVFDQVWPWVQLENKIGQLTPYNALRAKAKILIFFDENLDRNSMNAWNNRYVLSKEPFRIENTPLRILRVAGFSMLTLICSSAILWIVLILMSWFWYFILDRISELADAVREKPGSDS